MPTGDDEEAQGGEGGRGRGVGGNISEGASMIRFIDRRTVRTRRPVRERVYRGQSRSRKGLCHRRET